MTGKIVVMTALSLLLMGNAQEKPGTKTGGVGVNAMTEASLADSIKTLASDEFEGRAPSTVGEEKTLAYLQKTFKGLGLEPVNSDSYLQKVPLVSIEAMPDVSLSFSGGNASPMQPSYIKDYVIGTRRMVKTLDVKDSELVFAGYGINAPERGWNDYEGIDVKGKTVVVLVNDPGYATQDEKLFGGNAMTYYGRWIYKYDEAARQGAAGVIIIHDTKPASYPFSVVQSGWTGKQFYTRRSDNGMSLSAMEGWVTHDLAKNLFKHAGLDLAEMEKAAAKPGFKAVSLHMTVSATIHNTIEYAHSYNVAGMIKGSEVPDEAFIYMAHWDHLGMDKSIEGDQIYNGAIDNASGTAGVLELAKAFSSLKEKPKRSIIFLALTSEEQGKLGSAYYADNPLFPLEKTVAGLNLDGLNSFGVTRDINVIGFGMSELDGFFESSAKKVGRYLRPDPNPEKGYFYRSDHFEFSKRGVPTLFPEAGLDHIEKGEKYGREMTEKYTKEHYHQPSDEYDDTWVLDGAIADLQLFYDMGFTIANSDVWPEWLEGTEFKAIREKQLAGNK